MLNHTGVRCYLAGFNTLRFDIFSITDWSDWLLSKFQKAPKLWRCPSALQKCTFLQTSGWYRTVSKWKIPIPLLYCAWNWVYFLHNIHILYFINSDHFFPLFPPPSAGRLGWTRCWEGTQPGWVPPTNQRHIPDQMSCSTINAEGKDKEGDPHGYGVCLPKQTLHMLRPNFPEVAKHLPTNGEQRINFPFCFAWTHSFASLQLLNFSLNPQIFLLVLFLFSSSHSTGGVWASVCVGTQLQAGLTPIISFRET